MFRNGNRQHSGSYLLPLLSICVVYVTEIEPPLPLPSPSPPPATCWEITSQSSAHNVELAIASAFTALIIGAIKSDQHLIHLQQRWWMPDDRSAATSDLHWIHRPFEGGATSAQPESTPKFRLNDQYDVQIKTLQQPNSPPPRPATLRKD